MPKKTPVMQLLGTDTFPTKGAADAFAIKQRADRNKVGMKTRYEIDMNPQTGEFRVREYLYATDTKGRLI
jgi:hypothetical protein